MDALPRGIPQEGRVGVAGGERPWGLRAPGVGKGHSTVGGSYPPGSCHLLAGCHQGAIFRLGSRGYGTSQRELTTCKAALCGLQNGLVSV